MHCLNDSVHGWPWTHHLAQTGIWLMVTFRGTWVSDMIPLLLSTGMCLHGISWLQDWSAGCISYSQILCELNSSVSSLTNTQKCKSSNQSCYRNKRAYISICYIYRSTISSCWMDIPLDCCMFFPILCSDHMILLIIATHAISVFTWFKMLEWCVSAVR